MIRIGVFIDIMNETIPKAFRENIISILKEFPEITYIIEEDLTSLESLKKMSNYIEKSDADAIIILGGSPKFYESSLNRFKYNIPINPYLVNIVNIREQLLWSTPEDYISEKAKELIKKSIRMVSHLKPIPSETISIKPEVMVIGGGLAGISVALEIAQSGISVSIIEKEEEIGGGLKDLSLFYPNLEDAIKWIKENISRVVTNQNIKIFYRCEPIHIKGHLGRFEAKIRKYDGSEIILSPSAIVVTIGISKELKREGIYGYRKIITLAEMEKMISDKKENLIDRDGKEVKTVTFLLDQANEDIKIDSINAIKQSLILHEKFNCQAVIIYKDIKVSSDGIERLYRRAREEGVIFFKYAESPQLSLVGSQIKIDIKDTSLIRSEDQWPVSILTDLLVLCESIKPNPFNEKISKILKINLGPNGFLMDDNPQLLRIRSNRRGIFIAGGCRFPQTISETLIEAKATAQEIINLIGKGTYNFDLAVAEVDPNRCALCYTCPRLCPHSAITIEKYSEKNIYFTSLKGKSVKWFAARVDPASCYGCGICVAECPAKAIKLHHVTDELIFIQMGL